MNKESLISDLKTRIKETQEKRDYYNKISKAGMCLVMTGKIQAFNEIISKLK